jgi:hypothetical protein
MSNWTGDERRVENVAIDLMKEMREWLDRHEQDENLKYDRLQSEIILYRESSDKRHDDALKRIEQLSASTLSVVEKQNGAVFEIHKLFKEAFPEGDVQKHRHAHEQWIKKSAAEADFWLDVKKKAAASVLTGIVIWVGIALWIAFLQGPK